ncbi:hypothetical protein GCM10027270_29570 [Nocardioides ginkgobilobae]
MVLGLPTEIFVHEVLRLAALSSLAYVCVQRWHLGRWARLGAVSGCVGTLLYGYYLLSWALLTQADIRGPIQLRDTPGISTFLTWLDLLVLVGLVAAVVADRPGFARPGSPTPTYDAEPAPTGEHPPRA